MLSVLQSLIAGNDVLSAGLPPFGNFRIGPREKEPKGPPMSVEPVVGELG